MSEIEYDLENFKKEIDFYCDIEYTPKLEELMEKLLYTVKTWVLSYCNRVQRTDEETGELIIDEFIDELKPIALREAVRRFLLDLINKGQFKPHGSDKEGKNIQSTKIGDTSVTFGTSNKRSSKEVIESFQKQLIDELKEIKSELKCHRNKCRYGDIYGRIRRST